MIGNLRQGLGAAEPVQAKAEGSEGFLRTKYLQTKVNMERLSL